MKLELGMRIKKIRYRKSFTIQEIADASRLSKGFLSQVENGRVLPSIKALERIGRALGVPLTYLLLTEAKAPQIVRENKRQEFRFGKGQTIRAQVLSAWPERNLEMLLVELPPGESTGEKPHCHEGEECHLVLSGRIKATYGEESFILKEGDSFHWDGSVPHRVENSGKKTARLLIAMTPPYLSFR